MDEITQFIATLEEALNNHDAEAYNRFFAHDIAWGHPNGGLVLGWEPLHAVHTRFLDGPLHRSKFRYTVRNFKYLTPDIAHVHVQLIRTSADESAIESDECCLYMLVRSEGQWWVSAGHNTRVQAVRNAE